MNSSVAVWKNGPKRNVAMVLDSYHDGIPMCRIKLLHSDFRGLVTTVSQESLSFELGSATDNITEVLLVVADEARQLREKNKALESTIKSLERQINFIKDAERQQCDGMRV